MSSLPLFACALYILFHLYFVNNDASIVMCLVQVTLTGDIVTQGEKVQPSLVIRFRWKFGELSHIPLGGKLRKVPCVKSLMLGVN